MRKSMYVLLIVLCFIFGCVACGGTKIPKAVVENANGEKEEFTMIELADIAEENDLKFNKLYAEQPITVVGIVESVKEYSEDKNVMGMDGKIRTDGFRIYVEIKLKEGWIIKIYDRDTQDQCAELSTGDKVSIESQIWSEFAQVVTLSDISDYPTTITVIGKE